MVFQRMRLPRYQAVDIIVGIILLILPKRVGIWPLASVSDNFFVIGGGFYEDGFHIKKEKIQKKLKRRHLKTVLSWNAVDLWEGGGPNFVNRWLHVTKSQQNF